jgi:hypothetical protein
VVGCSIVSRGEVPGGREPVVRFEEEEEEERRRVRMMMIIIGIMMNSRNACYHCVQSLLYSCLLSKNLG